MSGFHSSMNTVDFGNVSYPYAKLRAGKTDTDLCGQNG